MCPPIGVDVLYASRYGSCMRTAAAHLSRHATAFYRHPCGQTLTSVGLLFAIDPHGRTLTLHIYTIAYALVVGLCILGRFRDKRWEATRVREDVARERRRLSAMSTTPAPAPQPRPFVWQDWDGPGLVAGRRA